MQAGDVAAVAAPLYAAELAPAVRVNVVCPGPTDTPLARKAHSTIAKVSDDIGGRLERFAIARQKVAGRSQRNRRTTCELAIEDLVQRDLIQCVLGQHKRRILRGEGLVIGLGVD